MRPTAREIKERQGEETEKVRQLVRGTLRDMRREVEGT